MTATEVDIDALRMDDAPDHRPPPHPQSNYTSSGSYSANGGGSVDRHRADSSLGSHSVYEDDEDEDVYDGSASDMQQQQQYRRMQPANSFNVEQMMNMRESNPNFRDSLMVNQQRQTEMGNALMRMDDGYRRTSSSNSMSGGRPTLTTSADGLTPLLQAARAGDLVLVNALIIQPGTDILRRDPVFGQTALHFAIRGGHLSVMQALLMPQLRGSIVNVADNRRNTALHLASAKSRRMTKVLLESGADVNFLNMRNQTPLGVHILTVTRDDPTLTEILLQYHADPNAPVDKSTALHVSLDKGLFQIASRLVRHGARLDLKDEGGKMVFDKVDQTVLKMLLSKVAHPPVWVPDEERNSCMECSKKFSSLGSRRHHCRYCGRVLCSACAGCHMRGSQLPFKHPSEERKKQKAEAHKKQRVCTTCYEIFMEGDTNTPAAHQSEASASLLKGP